MQNILKISMKKQKIIKLLKNVFLTLVLLCAVGALLLSVCNLTVIWSSEGEINLEEIPTCDAILILGAKVTGDTPSAILRDRLDKGCELYFAGVADRIIMSGDHGRVNYDEVNAMKAYAVSKGVPEEHIFTDHAGFDTYDSVYRAKKIFLCEKIVVVTQQFHINRAVFLASSVGLEAYGVTCSEEGYRPTRFTTDVREPLARVKAVASAVFKPKPTYLGESIPIYGEASASWD